MSSHPVAVCGASVVGAVLLSAYTPVQAFFEDLRAQFESTTGWQEMGSGVAPYAAGMLGFMLLLLMLPAADSGHASALRSLAIVAVVMVGFFAAAGSMTSVVMDSVCAHTASTAPPCGA